MLSRRRLGQAAAVLLGLLVLAMAHWASDAPGDRAVRLGVGGGPGTVPLFLVLVAILLWVFPDGRLPRGRWRRPSVILVVVGLLLSGATSMSGVVTVARSRWTMA